MVDRESKVDVHPTRQYGEATPQVEAETFGPKTPSKHGRKRPNGSRRRAKHGVETAEGKVANLFQVSKTIAWVSDASASGRSPRIAAMARLSTLLALAWLGVASALYAWQLLHRIAGLG